jgi:lysophospholipase L1-like esterase
MVDHLASTGAPTREEIAFGRAFITPGPLDLAAMALLTDPDRARRREAEAAHRRDTDWAQLGRYRDANAILRGGEAHTVFLGDSITEAWPLADPQLFSNGVVGRGISGQTSAQILVRLMPDAVALKPRTLHLMCGINDIAGNTGPSTPQDYMNNVMAMAALAKAAGVRLILGGITPAAGFVWRPSLPDPRPRIRALNDWLRDLANDQGAVFADYHGVLKDADDGMSRELSRDGVHPLIPGYDRMRPVVGAALAAAGMAC